MLPAQHRIYVCLRRKFRVDEAELTQKMSDVSTVQKQATPRVYTVNDESKYMIVRNVPALKCSDELLQLLGQYGPIEEYRVLDNEEQEPFTEVFWIKFVHINNARFAKRKVDDYNFFGNLLQVTYASQYESVSDTKEKLEERQCTVLHRLNPRKHKRLYSDKNTSMENRSPCFATREHQVLKTADCGLSLRSQCKNEIKNTVSKEYFSSPSMNATVQYVREKLDQISNITTHVSSKSHVSCEEGSSEINSSSASKKPKLDNRRRI